MKAKLLKKGYIYSKNNYTIYYSSNRYFFNALYITESAYTLKELRRIIKEKHNINL